MSDNESAGGGEMNEAQVRVTLERWLQADTPNEDVMEAWRMLCATLDATRGGTAIPTGAIHEVWTRTGGLAWPRGRETRPALRITPCETFGARGRTWALVEATLGKACASQTVASIYEAEPAAILAAIHAAPQESATLLVIGHNPGFEDLAALLAPAGDADTLARLRAKYPTAGLAVIRFDSERWADIALGAGRLVTFVTPKTLP